MMGADRFNPTLNGRPLVGATLNLPSIVSDSQPQGEISARLYRLVEAIGDCLDEAHAAGMHLPSFAPEAVAKLGMLAVVIAGQETAAGRAEAATDDVAARLRERFGVEGG
jgi:hypothetical protein